MPRVGAVEWIAFVFAMFTLYGCGPEPVLYGFVLLLLGHSGVSSGRCASSRPSRHGSE